MCENNHRTNDEFHSDDIFISTTVQITCNELIPINHDGQIPVTMLQIASVSEYAMECSELGTLSICEHD